MVTKLAGLVLGTLLIGASLVGCSQDPAPSSEAVPGAPGATATPDGSEVTGQTQ